MVGRQSILALGCLSLMGCTQQFADLKCDDVEREAVAMSKGRLIKITGTEETSRSPTELVCHGLGFYDTGNQTRTRYRAWLDEDHEIMIAWDTKEADDAVWNYTVRKAERENEEADRRQDAAVDRVIDGAGRDLPDQQ